MSFSISYPAAVASRRYPASALSNTQFSSASTPRASSARCRFFTSCPALAALGRKEQCERRGIAVPVCLRRQKYRERVFFGNAEMRERLAAFGIKPVIGDGVPRPLQRGAEVFFRLRRHALACAIEYGLFLFLLRGRLQAPLFNELLEAETPENFICRARRSLPGGGSSSGEISMGALRSIVAR